MEQMFNSYSSGLSAITPESGFPKILRFDQCTTPSGRSYLLKFVFNGEHSPFLRIDSETHRTLSAKGMGKVAVPELKRFAWGVRSITGGYFSIDPFDGVVFGTMNPTVARGVYRNIEPDSTMSMLIYLRGIPTPVVVEKTFNQENRAKALRVGLGAVWDAECQRYNPQFRVQGLAHLPPKFMEVTITGLSSVFAQIEKRLMVSLGGMALIVDPKMESAEESPTTLPVADKTLQQVKE